MKERLFRGDGFDHERSRREDFDPIAEGKRYGLTPEESMELWERTRGESTNHAGVCNESLARERFTQMAEQFNATPGKRTQVEAASGAAAARNVCSPRVSGKTTQVLARASSHASVEVPDRTTLVASQDYSEVCTAEDSRGFFRRYITGGHAARSKLERAIASRDHHAAVAAMLALQQDLRLARHHLANGLEHDEGPPGELAALEGSAAPLLAKLPNMSARDRPWELWGPASAEWRVAIGAPAESPESTAAEPAPTPAMALPRAARTQPASVGAAGNGPGDTKSLMSSGVLSGGQTVAYKPRDVSVGSGPSRAPQVEVPEKQTRVMELEARMPAMGSSPPPLMLDTPGSATEHEAEHLGSEVAREASAGAHVAAGGQPLRPLTAAPLHPSLAPFARGGQPLPAAVREPFEQAYGTDLSAVQVHTDVGAQRLNRAMSAHALTSGGHVFMNPGQYAPDTVAGQALIGHELGHAVQQQGRSGVMQRATDMEALAGTKALPEFQFESMSLSVQEAVDRRDKQMGGVARDTNYNNLVKRGFEDDLATFVFHHWDLVKDVVLAVSRQVLVYFERRTKVDDQQDMLQLMQKIGEVDTTLGYPGFIPQSAEEGAKILNDQIPASLPAHLNVHGKFSYALYNGEKGDFKTGVAERVLGRGARNYVPELMPDELFTTDPAAEHDPERGRPRKKNLSDPAVKAPRVNGLAPDPRDSPLHVPAEIGGRPTNSAQGHRRGGDMFVVDESKRWTQEARLLYDMPVMAGPSGSAALMLNTAMVLGLSSEELRIYTMALVGSIVGGGHHSFHEIMTVAQLAGVPYTPGDYLSAIPPSFWRNGDFQELVDRYYESTEQFSRRTHDDSSEVSAETARALQFGLPPIRDDGDLTGLRDTIAARLKRKPSELELGSINEGGLDTKGVSGSPVFMVMDKVTGKPLGVIKVFQEFAEMAQEMSAMHAVNGLGIKDLHAPQVMAVGKLVKGGKGGKLTKDKGELGVVLSTVAPGVALDDMMADVAKASVPERPTKLEMLTTAVRAVADRLAAMHTQPNGSGAETVGKGFIELHTKKVMSYAQEIASHELAQRCGLAHYDLEGKARRICNSFAKHPGPAAIIHGDAHPGNFFFDSRSGAVTAIDLPTFDTSRGRNDEPIGSPARDAVNFMHKLETVGLSFQLTSTEIADLQEAFRTSYELVAGRRISEEAGEFFAMRVVLSELRTAIKEGQEAKVRPLIQQVKEI